MKTTLKISILISFSFLFLLACKKEINTTWEPEILKQFKQKGIASNLPDYSYAGYAYGEKAIPNSKGKIYNISNYGAIANDEIDDTAAINKTIEEAGKNGGGIVFFPKGKFLVNMDTTKTAIVRINYSNIILRGSGSEKNGTIIYSGTATNQAENNSPWLSPFVFHSGLNLFGTDRFFGVDELVVHSKITNNHKAGSSMLSLESTKNLAKGMIVLIALQNTTDDGNLIYDLMQPLPFEAFQKNYTEAGIQRAKSFQYPMEIAEVIDAHQIRLKQPLRRAISLNFNPTISIMPMLKNIGIEHFKFESAWDRNYKHHGNREMDYGWGAINLHRVSHGWIRNIHIDNYTQTTHLVNSRNVTIENIKITGKAGHYSPKTYHSSDNLMQNIKVTSTVTHGPSLEGCSFGNVYRNIHFSNPTPIDFHGMADKGFCPPMYNLYENITGIESIAGGAAPQNIPHAGEYNTFWNVEMTGRKDGSYHELFYSWIWRNPKQFKNDMHIDCHKQYLRSNVIGVFTKRTDEKLSIEHSFKDRSDAWIYVEGLNSTKKIVPLYESQLQLRLNNN
ncbi:glycosyl hydrolase family 28-related protein [Flavicella sediminum]|uniref:glycosyl hydrolase family 28-related protein n=1 Tax=Flavicella sediminum TaxID=2585141 RepID=UPI0011214E1E|nr:glycosyl hydrolase family 28-related protein [Flavicella sediminum]